MQMVARIKLPESNIVFCRGTEAMTFKPDDICLAMFDYGLDYGTILGYSELDDDKGTSDQAPNLCIVRKLTLEDKKQLEENNVLSKKAHSAFVLSTKGEKTSIKILSMRFSFNRDKLFIRYSAEIPVDLRRFMSQLQRDFKTHVDLWQVGSRDEVGLIGCLGPCGRAACCCTWPCKSRPANVKMVKTQEILLNPVLINGSCGKLKCCMGYEYDQYRVASANLPESGSLVTCTEHKNDEGIIIGRDVMRGCLTVRTADNRFLKVDAKKIKVIKRVNTYNNDKEIRYEDSVTERS